MFATQSASKWKILSFPVLAFVLALTSSSGRAQAPNVVADAQQVLGSGYSNPQSIAISSNGTIYVADTKNNQILNLQGMLPALGQNSVLSLPSTISQGLAKPQALAVDANGDLFIAD